MYGSDVLPVDAAHGVLRNVTRRLLPDVYQLCIDQGGLNDQARQICKNLEYAIAIATRPGQIEYYQPSEEAKRIVENGELVALAHKIARLQREIDQVGLPG